MHAYQTHVLSFPITEISFQSLRKPSLDPLFRNMSCVIHFLPSHLVTGIILDTMFLNCSWVFNLPHNRTVIAIAAASATFAHNVKDQDETTTAI